jgi:hypothetical protein
LGDRGRTDISRSACCKKTSWAITKSFSVFSSLESCD